MFATARDITRIRHLQIMGMDVLSLDVIDPESIRRAVEAVVDETDGSLDLLVNNAGSGKQRQGPILHAAMVDPSRVCNATAGLHHCQGPNGL